LSRTNDIIAAIEIGTSSIKVSMAQPLDDGSISVIAFHETPCQNRVIKGEIYNVDATVELLGEALDHVEATSGKRISSAYLAVTGAHIGSINVQGSVPVRSYERKIADDDLVEATRHARAYNLPIDKIAVHSYQRSYIIDDQRCVSQPVGMIADKLTADIHFIYGGYNNIQTICNVVDEVLGFPANDISFSGIADIYGLALGADHRKGILVVDIGAGVTEYVVFYEDGCMHSGQITVGCDHIANDLSIGLRLPINKCREILKNHGSAVRKADGSTKCITVETALGHPPRVFKESTIQTVIELRLLELFEIINADLERQNVRELIGEGVILCGGGALITDIVELTESFFNIPAKIGQPGNVSGEVTAINSPRFVTTIGLLHLGYQLRQMEDVDNLPIHEVMKRDFVKFFNIARKAIRF